MNLKKKNFGRIIFVLAVLILIIFVLVMILKPKSYEKIYKVDEYEVRETYNREFDHYNFTIDMDGVMYSMGIKSEHIRGHELVEHVRTWGQAEYSCILMTGEKIDGYPICFDGENYLDYDLIPESDGEFYKRDEVKVTSFNYEGIEVKNTFGKKYLVWDYRGYHYMTNQKQETLDFLEKESYYNNLAYQVDEFVITPYYDENYAFTSFVIIDMKKGKSSLWKLDEEISYNSYFLGDRDGLIYMVDRKNKAEYSIDSRKKKIERIDKDGMGKVWNSKWEEMSITRLCNDDYKFANSDVFTYTLEDKKLTLSMRAVKDSIKVTNRNVDKIVWSKDDEVFYLVGDELYSYSPSRGEKPCLKYTELNFNNLNSIFVY